MKYDGSDKIIFTLSYGYPFVDKPDAIGIVMRFQWFDPNDNKFKYELAWAKRTFTVIPVEFEYKLPSRPDWKIVDLKVENPWKGVFELWWNKPPTNDETIKFRIFYPSSWGQSKVDEEIAYKLKDYKASDSPWQKISVTTPMADSDILSYFGLTYGKKLVIEKLEAVTYERGYDNNVKKWYNEYYPKGEIRLFLEAFVNGKYLSLSYNYIVNNPQPRFRVYEGEEKEKLPSVQSECKKLAKEAIDKAWAEAKDILKSFKFKPKQVEVKLGSTEIVINEKEYGKFAKQTPTPTPTPKKNETKPLKYTLSLSKTSITVYNNGIFNTGTPRDSNFLILANVKAEGGDPNIDPYQLVYVVGRIVEGDNAPIGFHIEGSSTLVSSIRAKPSSGLASFHVMTKGAMGPNKGLKFNSTQKIEFQLVNATTGRPIGDKVIFTANLLDAAPIIIIIPGDAEQVQEGTERVFKLKVIDPDNKDKPIRVVLSVKTGLIREANKDWAYTIYLTLKPEEEVKIGYKAPDNIGNFDLVGEIEGLSMWSIQKSATLKSLVMDTISFGLEKKIEALKKAESGSQAIFRIKRLLGEGDVGEAYANVLAVQRALKNWERVSKVWSGYTFYDGVSGAYSTAAEDLPKGYLQVTRKGGKTTLEKVAEWGVFGITLAQTAVGAVTLVTDKLPVIGQVTAGLSLTFNAATNIWKGNLEYLSKVEKINRAEERFIPIVITVTATDNTGFEVNNYKIYLIVYFWV